MNVVRGTCADMCPSSERKFRIKNNLVSNFECSNGTPNESRMIKEYRRSAAGQAIERKELRTIEALSHTMNYIIYDIVDKFDGGNSKKIQVWYDFIWNRTRAIRKDITVQQLTGRDVIEIEERCARFHILCSYLLCDEQSNVFDFKINETNLMNCIQILREMYQNSFEDQSNHSGQSNQKSNDQSNQLKDTQSNKSENIQQQNHVNMNNTTSQFSSTEFLCYYILQNLDKENLVNDISLIDRETRQSSDIQFAIEVFIAYNTQNYCKFIRLLIRSTLLQACILNRYLNKIRLNAIFLIRKAVTVGQQKILIPQEYFMKQLCFRQNEFRTFCKQINCDLQDDSVAFSKSKELNLVTNFKLNRNTLIDFKLGKLKLSEIISGTCASQTPVNQLFDLFKKVDFFNNP